MSSTRHGSPSTATSIVRTPSSEYENANPVVAPRPTTCDGNPSVANRS